jgi:hypothetical protein
VATWPLLPRLALFVFVALAIGAALWWVVIRDTVGELQAEREREASLQADFLRKLPQALNLEGLKRQREQVQQQVTQLEKQLPGRAEMDALLSDINQAGLARSFGQRSSISLSTICASVRSPAGRKASRDRALAAGAAISSVMGLSYVRRQHRAGALACKERG